MQACGHYVGEERTTVENRMEMGRLIGIRVNQHCVSCQGRHTLSRAVLTFAITGVQKRRFALLLHVRVDGRC